MRAHQLNSANVRRKKSEMSLRIRIQETVIFSDLWQKRPSLYLWTHTRDLNTA